MVPEGWSIENIESVCVSIIDCVNKTAPLSGSVTKYRMLRTTNIRDGRVDASQVKYVEKDVYEDWTRRGSPKKGDLIFTRETPVGEVGILEDDDHVFLGQRLMMYRADEEKTTSKFLLYALLTPYCQRQIENFSSGGTVAHMRVPDCGKIKIPLPPLPEQKKIAAILSTWDEAIEKLEKLIAAKRRRKLALMQRLLTGKVRLPGFGTHWKRKALSQFLLESRIPGSDGLTARKITIRLYGKGACQKDEKRQGSEQTKYFIRKSGQFIYSKLDFLNGAFAIIPPVLDGYESTLDLPAFDVKDGMDAHWLNYFISRESFYKHYVGLAAGGRKARRVNPPDFLSLSIPVPPLGEQQAIAKIILELEQEISLSERQLSALKTQKRGLMQKLLTGQWRVGEEGS